MQTVSPRIRGTSCRSNSRAVNAALDALTHAPAATARCGRARSHFELRRLTAQRQVTVANDHGQLGQHAAARAAREMGWSATFRREANLSFAGRGSIRCTSNPAPAIVPFDSASNNASSSTSRPRVVLTNMAPRFIAAKNALLASFSFS